MLEQTSGIDFYGVNIKTQRRSSNSEIMFCGFPRDKRHIWASWFSPYYLPNNTIIVYVNNFEPNLVLVNINKLKPYKYVDQTLKVSQSLDNQKCL
jgi:hypothetical protein